MSAAGERTGPAAWWAIGVIALAGFVSILDRSSIAVMAIDIRASLHLSDTQISLTQGLAFAAVYCLASLWLGALADRVSRRVLLCAGMVVWSLAASSMALAHGFGGLAAARMMIGLGEATVTPCALSMLAQLRPPERLAGAISLFVAAGTAGTGAAFALGGWLLDHVTAHPWIASIEPWRQSMVALGLPGLLAALLVLTIREPVRDAALGASSRPSVREFWDFVRSNAIAVAVLLIPFGLASMMTYSAMGWGATYGRRVIGMSPSEVGGAMGLIAGVGGILASIGGGLLVDALTKRGMRDATIRCFLIACPVSMVVGGLGFLADDARLFLLGVVAVQFGIGSLFGALMALQQVAVPPAMRGRMGALTAMVSNIVGFGLGPFAVGVLTDHVFAAPDRVGWSIAVVLLVAGAFAVMIMSLGRGRILRLIETRSAA